MEKLQKWEKDVLISLLRSSKLNCERRARAVVDQDRNEASDLEMEANMLESLIEKIKNSS